MAQMAQEKKMNMTTLVLDFKTGTAKIIKHDSTQDVEELLTENYGYDLGSIEYMTVQGDLVIEV